MKCVECGGTIQIKKIPYLYNDRIYLGDFEAEICLNCNTTYFTQDSYKKIEIVAKRRLIWGAKNPSIIEARTVKIKQDVPKVDYFTLFGDSTIKPEFALTAGGY